MAQIKFVEFSALPQNIPTILKWMILVADQLYKASTSSRRPRFGAVVLRTRDWIQWALVLQLESGGAICSNNTGDPSATPQFAGSDDNTVGSGLTRQLAPGFDPRQQAAFDPAMSVSAEDVIQREQLYGDIDRYTSIPTSTGPIAGTFGFDDGTVSEPPTSGGGTGGIGGRGGLGFGFDLGGGLIGGSPTDFGSSLSDFEGLADTNFAKIRSAVMVTKFKKE